MFRVHVAGQPDDQIQRCRRCHEILVDARGGKAPEGSQGMRAFASGAFVAVVAKGHSRGMVVMDHDARDADEFRCDQMRPMLAAGRSLVGLTIPERVQ